MVNEVVAETTVTRILELIEELAGDERWIRDILEVTDTGDAKAVIKTVNNVMRLVENEFDF